VLRRVLVPHCAVPVAAAAAASELDQVS
jgi:hypothetical protein